MILGSNKSYEFWLFGKPNSFWIKGLHRYKLDEISNPNLANMVRTGKEYYRAWPLQLYAPFQGTFITLGQAIQRPEFKITGTKEARLDGADCHEFTWRFVSTTGEFPQSGAFWVQPELGWRLVGIDWKYEAEGSVNIVGKARFSNFQLFRGAQLPRHLEFDQTRSGDSPTSTSYDVDYSAEFLSEIFYVSHYGLPEPPGIVSPWKVWQLTLIGLTAATLSIGVFGRFFRKLKKEK
jgi:hypothetical protein